MRAVDEATFASLEAEAKTAEVLPPKHAVAPTVLRPSPSRISPRASTLQRLPEYPFGETSSVAPPPSSNGHTNGTARRIQFAWLAKAEEAAEADDDASTPLLEALRQPNPSAERVLALITPEAAQQPDSTRMLPLHWAPRRERGSLRFKIGHRTCDLDVEPLCEAHGTRAFGRDRGSEGGRPGGERLACYG
jgi:hypothetical protein